MKRISLREFQLHGSKYIKDLPVMLTQYNIPIAIVDKYPEGFTDEVVIEKHYEKAIKLLDNTPAPTEKRYMYDSETGKTHTNDPEALKYTILPSGDSETDLTGRIPSKDVLNQVFSMPVANTTYEKCDFCFAKTLLKEKIIIRDLERVPTMLCTTCIKKAEKEGIIADEQEV